MVVPGPRSGALIALALALWVLVVAVGSALPATEVTPAHGPHVLQSALLGEPPVVIEHPHISDPAAPLFPDAVAEVVLPRTSTSLIALVLIAALAGVVSLWSQSPPAAVRGPPRPLSTVLSVRVMLTRLCTARC